MKQDLRLIASIALWVVSLCVLAHAAVFAWLLRDGLRPGTVDSEGVLAYSRAWEDFRRPLLWVAFPILMGFLISPWALHPELHESE
jgi:hypothetical protein